MGAGCTHINANFQPKFLANTETFSTLSLTLRDNVCTCILRLTICVMVVKTRNVRDQIDPITSVFEIRTWLGISIKLVAVIIADDPD